LTVAILAAEPKALTIDLDRTALFIIDMQRQPQSLRNITSASTNPSIGCWNAPGNQPTISNPNRRHSAMARELVRRRNCLRPVRGQRVGFAGPDDRRDDPSDGFVVIGNRRSDEYSNLSPDP
jgi:hypothetical protein